MIIKLLGFLDIFTALAFWILIVFNIGSGIVLFLGLFLLAKGIVFITNLNIASILDIISSVIVIIGSSAHINLIIAIAVSLFLLQKGILSMIS